MENLEFKTRLAALAAVVERLRTVGATASGLIVQRDTYFLVPRGRLKLREMPERAEMIEYDRDERGPELRSRYTRTPVPHPAALRDTLAARHGIRGVVEKTRALWLYQNARIHLDQVTGLGAFLEIEVVEPRTPEDGSALLDRLIDALALDCAAAIRQSYIDLLEERSAESQPR